MEKDNRQSVVESYAWHLLLDVAVSQRSPTEFTIDLLLVHNHNIRQKERLQMLQSGNKANQTTQMVLHCAQRDKLVAEMKHIMHIKNNGAKPVTQHTCWYKTELFQEYDSDVKTKGKHQVCKAKLYPTAIHMLIDRQSVRRTEIVEREGQMQRRAIGEILPPHNNMASLLVSGINHATQFDGLDTTQMMESRMMLGGSGEEEDGASSRSFFKTGANYLQSRPFHQAVPMTALNDFQAVGQEEIRAEQELELYNQQIEQVLGNDFLGFGEDRDDREVDGNYREADGNAVGVNAAIGIMGSGANIKTAFGANYARNPSMKLKDKYSQHAIYLNELTQVLTQDYVVSLVKENQEIEQIVFKDAESFTNFTDQISNSYLDLMKRPLQMVKLHQIQSLRSKVEFLNWPGCDHRQCNCEKSCFKVAVEFVQNQRVLLSDYSIELDQQNIYLVSQLSGKPAKQMPLVCLQTLRVVDDNPNCNLMLSFEKDVQMNVKAKTLVDRERLIASILTMRNLVISDKRGISTLDNLIVLQNHSLDHSHKIQAYSPIEDSLGNFIYALTTEYESGLIRKLSELMRSEVQTMQLDNVIDEILLNATFCYITKIPETFVRVIMDDLKRCFQHYLEYEEHNADLIDVFLEKGTLQMLPEARLNFLATLRAAGGQIGQQAVDKEENLLFKTERHIENIKALEETFEQTIRYLNVLKRLLNSRVFMQEISNYQDILQYLTLLLISKSSVIAQLAASVIKAACHHYSGSESKLEKVNKRVLIRASKSEYAQAQSKYTFNPKTHSRLSISYVKTKGKVHFFEAIFDYLLYFDRLYDEKGIIKSLHLAGINLILSSILQDRQQSTAKEDLAVFAETVSHQEYVTDERSCTKAIFQLFDKFCLLDGDFFDIQYMFTMMLTQSLDYFFDEQDSTCLKELQGYVLTYSIQFIWHLYLLMTSKISHQRTLSIKLLARILHSNQESHDLLLRILPRTLFHKVKANRQSIESLQWNLSQWIEFFTQIVPRNFNSATEQWNNETRAELTAKLLQAKKYFIEVKQLNQATITSAEGRQLLLPIHEFSQGKLVMSRWKNLQWNNREFEVQYSCLASEYLVGRYFLTRLLQFSNSADNELESPQLTMQVIEPKIFWNELLMQFMASKDEKEHKMIIMTMCVLYKKNSDEILEMKTIPYWLKLIEHPEFASVHFLLMQLIHVALSVKGDLAKANMQLLIKAKGFHVLNNCMNIVFRELMPSQSQQERQDNNRRNSPQQNQRMIDFEPFLAQESIQQARQDGFHQDFNKINFTDSTQLSRYFKLNTLNINKGILALRIVDQVFKSMQFQYHLPMPTNAEYMLQKHALATLSQMIMLQNLHLTREVLHFIEQHLNNHYSLYKLKNSGLIEFLIVALNTRNGERALSLLLSVQDVCITFNENLDFKRFNIHDLQMIKEDRDAVFLQEEQALNERSGIFNGLEISGVGPQKDPTTPLFDEVYANNKRQGKRLPPLLESIFLRYLPTPFIKFLFERGQGEFLKVYRMDSYKHPILIWNKELRTILEQRICQKAQQFIGELTSFAADSVKSCIPTEIPIYGDSVQSVINFVTIEQEVRCGRYYLSVWTDQAKKEQQNFYVIPQNEEKEFHIKIKAELQQCIEKEKLSDRSKIITLLKSCLLALKKFSVKRIQCLAEIKKILVHTAAPADAGSVEFDKKMILFTGMRIISMAIHQDKVNREETLAMDGVRTISGIIGHILSVNKQDQRLLSKEVDEVPVKENHNSQILDDFAKLSHHENEVKDISTVDRIDAKTLNLAVESITTLVNEDIRTFMEYPLLQRINIFKQMSQLLDLSFQLFPLLEKRKLKPFTLSAEASNPAAFADQDTDTPTQKYSHRLSTTIPLQVGQIQTNQVQNIQQTMNPKAVILDNARMPQTPSKVKTVNQDMPRGAKNPEFDYKNLSLMSIIHESKQKSLEQRPDAYSVCLIFNITSAIFRLMKSVAVYPMAHPELIASGLFWRTIQHCFFDLTEKLYRRSSILKTILRECTYSLRLMVTFVDKFMKCKPEEQQKFGKLFANKTELSILGNFHECIKKLFTAKILEKLFIQFVITREIKLEMTDGTSNNDFLRLFSTQQLQSPELVWNDETRKEMHDKLKSQIRSMESGSRQSDEKITEYFCNEIKDFQYSVNRTELRIQGIFVKYFNEQCRQGVLGNLTKTKLAKFADQIIEKLKEFSAEPHEHAKNIRELVEAFKNLIISLNLVIKSELDFELYFKTLCDLINLKAPHSTEAESGKWEIELSEKQRLFELSSHILEIFFTLVKRRLTVPPLVYQQPTQQQTHGRLSNRLSVQSHQNSGRNSGMLKTPVMIDLNGKVLTADQQAEQMCHLQHGNYLLKCQPFFRLMVRIMYQREIQAVPFKEEVLPMLQDMINISEFVMRLFIDQGLIMFLLNLIFDTKYSTVISKEMRGNLTDQVLKIDRVMQGMDRGNLLGFSDRQSYGVVKAFIPPNFFAEINEQMWRWKNHHQAELVQLQMRFLDNFDADYFENALVKWDRGLREQSLGKVRDFCEKILRCEPICDLRSLDQIVNMELEKEERIMEVILRNYNQNPAVFINTKLNVYITEVANHLFSVSQQLYALRQDDIDGMLKKIKIDRLRENPELMTNTQRKYKYLCYQAQLQLTSLLLSIEQLLYNEYNPNLLQTRQDEKLDAQSRLTAQLIQRTTDIRQVEEKVFKYFNLWLQYPVFLDDEMCENIRITFLQAVFLVIDIPTSMTYFKKSEVPLEFISSMIQRIVKEQGKEARIVEDSLILLVCQKMLRVDLQYTCPQLALKDTLDQLVKIAITKRPLQRYIKQILYLISQNTHYSTNVIEVLERNNGNRQDLDRLRGQSNSDFFNQVWRAKPNSAIHARTYYEWSDSHTIQRTLYSGQLDKLPILSPEAIKKIKYEFLPDEIRDFIENTIGAQLQQNADNRLSWGSQLTVTAQSEVLLTSALDQTAMAEAVTVEEESKENGHRRVTTVRGNLIPRGVIEEEEKGASDDPDETDFMRDKNYGNDDDEEKVLSGISPEEMNNSM